MGVDTNNQQFSGPTPKISAVALKKRQRRIRDLQTVLLAGCLAGLSLMAASLYFYFQTVFTEPLPQLLSYAGILLGALLVMGGGYLALRRDQVNLAGYLTLLAYMLAFGGSELIWKGDPAFSILLGTLALLLLGILVLPGQWLIWLLAVGVYGGGIYALNWFEPLPRYDIITRFPEIRWVVGAISIALSLGLLAIAVRAFRFGTIRTRLVLSFVSLVLLIILSLGVGVVYLGIESGQQQTLRQLESVLTLKEAEVNTWVSTLQSDLGLALTGEIAQRSVYVLTLDLGPLQEISYNRALAHFESFIAQTERYDDLMLVNPQGVIMLSTEPAFEGQMFPFARDLTQGAVFPPYYDLTLQRSVMAITRPIYDEKGNAVGLIAGHANLNLLRDIMLERAGLGETGETYVVRNADALTPLKSLYRGGITTEGVQQVWNRRTVGLVQGNFFNYDGLPVLGVYQWLPTIQVVLVAEQQQAEALQGAFTQLLAIGGITLGALAVAVVVALVVTRGIVNPLTALVTAAQRIAAGDLELTASVRTEDELSVLAEAFNSMTLQLRALIATLEERVTQRTADLEQRSNQLQASAQVARQATEIQDLGQLLSTTVHLIVERFAEYYHAGIFLLDENKTFAVLRAASSEGGQRMLARGHKLKVGETGIVGFAAATGEPRIALDVGADAQYFNNPDLPTTRSELALPLKIGQEVIGVLDVQSELPEAFGEDDVAVLLTMADQVAVAIQNARLLSQMQEQLQEIGFLLRTQNQEAWQRFVAQRAERGYVYDGVEVTALERTQYTPDGAQVSLPLQGRSGEQIGRLDLRFGERRATPGELALAQAIAQQATQSLDSARLFQQTQEALRRSESLYQAGQILIDFENIEQVLLAVAQGIASALPADRVVLILFDMEQRQVTHFAGGGPNLERVEPVPYAELEQGLSGWVLRELKPALSSKTTPDPRESPEVQQRRRDFDCGSIMVVPLIYTGQVLGTVTAINRPDQPDFTADDVTLVVAMANQAAAAIQNARLFDETQALLNETEILYQASRTIGAAHAPEDILQSFVDYAASERVGRCILGIFDSARTQTAPLFHVLAAWNRGEPRATAVSGQQWGAEQLPVLNRYLEEPMLLANLAETSELDEISRLTFWGRLGIQAMAAIPLTSGGKPLGWILLEVLDGPYEFTERERRLFRTLADSASVVLENLRLLETTRRRADYEQRKAVITSRVRASADIDAILRASVLELGKVLRAEDVLVVLAPPEAETPGTQRSRP